jgi:hypothetical protein
MLEPGELATVASAYGVAENQVRRDHLISHVLLALSTMDVPVIFFGVAAEIDGRIPTLLRREFPGTTWDPPLRTSRAVEPGQLVTRDGLRVRVQLLDASKHQAFAQWPAATRQVDPRYRDIGSRIELRVPTLMSFAGMKTAAWMDRHKARDLYDLWGLAALGALTAEAADGVREITGGTVASYEFRSLPSSLDWEAQLGHQTRTLPSATECLVSVREAYAKSLGWPAPADPFAQ